MINLKKITIGILLTVLLFSSLSCSFQRHSQKEASARAKVENVESMLGTNFKNKLNELSSLTYGINYALNKEENPSSFVGVAKDLSGRALSLTGQPSLEEIKKMEAMIEDLTSQLANERVRGKAALDAKDKQISTLQTKSKELEELKEIEIKKYMQIASATAAKADELQVQMNKMDSWMGLGAIFYGLKKFIVSSMWILGIGSILYLVLRFASMSNPLAASIFSIFDTIMSWGVNVIKLLAPKALEVAGHTSKAIANQYKNTMIKMVDGIESLKERQKAIGDPNKKYTLDELLSEFSKMMDSNEKAMVEQIKRDIGYTG